MSTLATGTVNPRATPEILRYARDNSSVVDFIVATSEKGLCYLALGNHCPLLVADIPRRFATAKLVHADRDLLLITTTLQQLIKRPGKEIEFAIDHRGSQFQANVWRVLQTIPTGETRTYKEIARSIGKPKACHAGLRHKSACIDHSLPSSYPQ